MAQPRKLVALTKAKELCFQKNKERARQWHSNMSKKQRERERERNRLSKKKSRERIKKDLKEAEQEYQRSKDERKKEQQRELTKLRNSRYRARVSIFLHVQMLSFFISAAKLLTNLLEYDIHHMVVYCD